MPVGTPQKKLSAVSLKLKAEVGARDINPEIVIRQVVGEAKSKWDDSGRWCIMRAMGQGWK